MKFSPNTTNVIAVASLVLIGNAAVAPPAYEATSLAAPSPVSYAAGPASQASSKGATVATVAPAPASSYVASSEQHATVHYTRTTVLTRTLTSTLSSSSAFSSSMLESSPQTVYTLESSTSSIVASTTSTPALPPQTHTIIRISSSLCEAGQTVTKDGQATVLTTPSMSSYLATSVMTRSLCPSSALESASASPTSNPENEPLSSYVSMASSSPIYFSSQTIPTAPIATKQFAPTGSSLASSSLLVPVSSSSSYMLSNISASGTSAGVEAASSVPSASDSSSPNAAPSAASGSAPYPALGSSAASSFASGTGTGTIGLYPTQSSIISPYNPNAAVAGTPTTLNMVGACAIFAIAAFGISL